MSTATSIASDLMRNDTPIPGCTFAAGAADVLGRAERGEPIIHTLPCGVALLDETTGGLVRGEFLGVTAAPGLGKSLFADRVALGALRHSPDSTALIFNLETATPVRISRLIAGQSVTIDDESHAITQYVGIGRLLHGKLTRADVALAQRTVERLNSENIGRRLRFVDDVGDAPGIAALIAQVKPELVIVDHLGLVEGGAAAGASSTERIDDALHTIVAAIREAHAAGVIVAEVSKAGLIAGAADASAVRGSARFASLAGQLVGILRDPNHEGDDPQLLFQLHKNRHGRALMEQAAILYGGMSYLHFGAYAPIPPAKKKDGDRKKRAAE